MNSNNSLERRAICLEQTAGHPLYLFALTGEEILQIADISRINRDDQGELIGYQRPAVRKHIQEISDYLDQDEVLFPNAIILALPSTVRFKKSRGPGLEDSLASAGRIVIPVPKEGEPKPGFIVDGQQRTLALLQAKRNHFTVPISAFIADSIGVQRDQFMRVNNAKPVPRSLVTELLPEVKTQLPPRLAARKIPSALCDELNRNPESPFFGIIRRASTPKSERKKTVITDTSIVNMLVESLGSTAGCLFPYRNVTTGESDFESMWGLLTAYWSAVRDVFPEAWGKPARQSRLMHGAGIRSMGRLMDHVMNGIDPEAEDAYQRTVAELEPLVDICRWTSGHWEELGPLAWNEVQNVPKHINTLSNFMIRTYVQSKRARSKA